MGTETHPTDLEQPVAFVLMMRVGTANATVATLREVFGTENELAQWLINEITNQTPVRLPEKVGAVVQSSDRSFFIRWSYDAHTTQPWIAAVDLDNPIRSEDLPLITKVHFEGVDV
jgi:hypothetical protein